MSAFLGCRFGSLSIYWVTPMRIPKLIIAAFVLTNLCLIAACLFALKENVGLRRAVAYDEALPTPAKGEAMPPLLGTDWTGAPQTLDYGQDPRPTIVYTFSKECGYCQENWRAMRSFQALSPRRLRIVYIDTTGDLLAPTYLAAAPSRNYCGPGAGGADCGSQASRPAI